MTEEKKEELTLKIVLEDCITWLESIRDGGELNEEVKKRHEGKTLNGKYFKDLINNLIKKEQEELNQKDSNLKEVKEIKDLLDKINSIAGNNAEDKVKSAFGTNFMQFRQTINQFEENINKGGGTVLAKGGVGTGRRQTPKVIVKKPKEDQTSEPVNSEPAKSQPPISEQKKPEPTKSQPPKSEPVNSEPAKSQPPISEQKKPEPTKPEQPKSEPAQSEPTKSQPPKSEPAQSEPTKSQPPISEQKKPEPTKSQPPKSEPVNSEPAKSQPPISEQKKPEPTKPEQPKSKPAQSEPPKSEPAQSEPTKSENSKKSEKKTLLGQPKATVTNISTQKVTKINNNNTTPIQQQNDDVAEDEESEKKQEKPKQIKVTSVKKNNNPFEELLNNPLMLLMMFSSGFNNEDITDISSSKSMEEACENIIKRRFELVFYPSLNINTTLNMMPTALCYQAPIVYSNMFNYQTYNFIPSFVQSLAVFEPFMYGITNPIERSLYKKQIMSTFLDKSLSMFNGIIKQDDRYIAG